MTSRKRFGIQSIKRINYQSQQVNLIDEKKIYLILFSSLKIKNFGKLKYFTHIS